MKTFLSRSTAALTLAAYTASFALGQSAYAGEHNRLSKDWTRAVQLYSDASKKDTNSARKDFMDWLRNKGISQSFLYELDQDLKTSLALPSIKLEGKELVVSAENESVRVEQVNALNNEFLVNGHSFTFVPDMGYSYNQKRLEEILSPKSNFSWNPVEWFFPKAQAIEPMTIGLIIVGIAVIAAIWIAIKAKSEAKDARADAQRAVSSAAKAESSAASLASKVDSANADAAEALARTETIRYNNQVKREAHNSTYHADDTVAVTSDVTSE